MIFMEKITLKIKQDCIGNVCPMPLKSVVGTIKGLKLINYDEKTEIAEFEYNDSIISKETITVKLKEKKYKIVG